MNRRTVDHLPESVLKEMISQANQEAVSLLKDREKGQFYIFIENDEYQIDLSCDISGKLHVIYDENCMTEEKAFSNVIISVNLLHSDPALSEEIQKSVIDMIENEVEEFLTA